MGDGVCNHTTEIIAIEDDDEDVEVVYSNISKTRIHRNVVYQKISKEIELLQAMCKHNVPKEFHLFKELAKKLGFQHGDDIIQSAWERLIKKHLGKVNSLQIKTIVPLVGDNLNHISGVVQPLVPLQTPVNVSPARADPAPSILHSSTPLPVAFIPPFTVSEVVPVALLKNQAVREDDLLNKGAASISIQEPNISGSTSDTSKISQKCSSSNKQVLCVNSPKIEDQAFVKSHVGVQAKIIRSKKTSTPYLKNIVSKKLKTISEAELKKFKAEQKRIKQQKKREFENEELQKVHNRLVDVIIPKYYNKDPNEKV